MTLTALAVLGLPFASFAAIALVRPLRQAGRLAGWLSIAAIACAFLGALVVWGSAPGTEALWGWIPGDEEPMPYGVEGDVIPPSVPAERRGLGDVIRLRDGTGRGRAEQHGEGTDGAGERNHGTYLPKWSHNLTA